MSNWFVYRRIAYVIFNLTLAIVCAFGSLNVMYENFGDLDAVEFCACMGAFAAAHVFLDVASNTVNKLRKDVLHD